MTPDATRLLAEAEKQEKEMNKTKGDRFDRNPGVVLHSWERKSGERIICSRSHGYGRRFHFRVWMLNSKGAYYPTRSGITLSIRELKKLRRALRKAIKMCEEG